MALFSLEFNNVIAARISFLFVKTYPKLPLLLENILSVFVPFGDNGDVTLERSQLFSV